MDEGSKWETLAKRESSLLEDAGADACSGRLTVCEPEGFTCEPREFVQQRFGAVLVWRKWGHSGFCLDPARSSASDLGFLAYVAASSDVTFESSASVLGKAGTVGTLVRKDPAWGRDEAPRAVSALTLGVHSVYMLFASPESVVEFVSRSDVTELPRDFVLSMLWHFTSQHGLDDANTNLADAPDGCDIIAATAHTRNAAADAVVEPACRHVERASACVASMPPNLQPFRPATLLQEALALLSTSDEQIGDVHSEARSSFVAIERSVSPSAPDGEHPHDPTPAELQPTVPPRPLPEAAATAHAEGPNGGYHALLPMLVAADSVWMDLSLLQRVDLLLSLPESDAGSESSGTLAYDSGEDNEQAQPPPGWNPSTITLNPSPPGITPCSSSATTVPVECESPFGGNLSWRQDT